MRITRTSWFCVLFLHVLYLTYYVFQVNQCICHFMGNITKSDDRKQLCLLEAQTNYSWVYKGNILEDLIKEGEGQIGPSNSHETLPVQLFQAHI